MTASEFVVSEISSPIGRAIIASFTVPGTAEPKGSMTAIVRNGRAVLVPGLNRKRKDGTRSDGRQRYMRWCNAVTGAAESYWRIVKGAPIHGERPLAVEIVFYLPKPPSTPKRVEHPIRKPDIDKLARAVLDCLTKSQLIADDARIVDLHVRKKFAFGSQQPHADILIREAQEPQG